MMDQPNNLQKFQEFRQKDVGLEPVYSTESDDISPLRDIRQTISDVYRNVPSLTDSATPETSMRINQNIEDIETFSPEIKTLDKLLGAQGTLTQGYGNPNSIYNSGVHGGIDIAIPEGTAVALPPGQWRIVQAFNSASASGPNNNQDNINGGYGNSILAENIETGEKVRLSHLSKVGVGAGQTINGGQVIALTGATGKTRGKTGQHIDIEYYNSKGQRSDILKSQYAQYIL